MDYLPGIAMYQPSVNNVPLKKGKQIRVGIVDDHEVVRMGLREYLEEHVDITVTAEADNGPDALELVRDFAIDVLILDLQMPGFSGFDAVPRLRARAPQTGILTLSGLPEAHYAIALLQKGVHAYLNKECDPEEIVKAVRAIAGGRKYLTPLVAELLAQEVVKPSRGMPHERLGGREFQIFVKLARGEGVSSIAHSLSLSQKTVSTYRTRALKKLNLASNSEITYYAIKHHLID